MYTMIIIGFLLIVSNLFLDQLPKEDQAYPAQKTHKFVGLQYTAVTSAQINVTSDVHESEQVTISTCATAEQNTFTFNRFRII